MPSGGQWRGIGRGPWRGRDGAAPPLSNASLPSPSLRPRPAPGHTDVVLDQELRGVRERLLDDDGGLLDDVAGDVEVRLHRVLHDPRGQGAAEVGVAGPAAGGVRAHHEDLPGEREPGDEGEEAGEEGPEGRGGRRGAGQGQGHRLRGLGGGVAVRGREGRQDLHLLQVGHDQQHDGVGGQVVGRAVEDACGEGAGGGGGLDRGWAGMHWWGGGGALEGAQLTPSHCPPDANCQPR